MSWGQGRLHTVLGSHLGKDGGGVSSHSCDIDLSFSLGTSARKAIRVGAWGFPCGPSLLEAEGPGSVKTGIVSSLAWDPPAKS